MEEAAARASKTMIDIRVAERSGEEEEAPSCW